MTMRKIAALLAVLALCLGMAAAHAATEYPPRPSGTVSDLAGVLNEQTIRDMETLNERLKEATGGGIYVLTRHFLGGMEAQRYADNVFGVWDLKENDALLLLVIGEESYALTLGSSAKAAVSAETKTALLGSHFRAPYLNRQYEAAVAELCQNLSQALAKAKNGTVDLSGLFGQSQPAAAASPAATPKPQSSSEFWNSMFARDDYDATENDNEQIWTNWKNQWNQEEKTINWRSVIIWALVIYFLFFRKKKQRPHRR